MSGRTKEAHSFKVFPFLAVLICTMGSLIFLLLVTSLKIRQKETAFAASERAYRNLAIAEAENSAELSEPVAIPDPEPEPPKVVTRPVRKPVFRPVEPVDDGYELALAERKRELTDLKTKARTRAEKLASEREQRLRVLALRRQQVEGTLEKTDELQSEIQQLENNLGEIAGEAAATNDPTEDAERVLVEQQILQMKRRLRAAQVADATAQNDQFQVVPFDPQTGTTRRPIFIECSAAGIRFLPEDILITAKDLEGFTPKANPIAAGTGALINYWTARNMKQQDPRSEPEPYVLMLVRPEGVVAYYVALRMLEPIRTAQGYELIEDSTALKLPDVDGGAKTACQSAVNRLMTERDKIARSALASGSGSSVFGGAPGRRGSGGGRPGGGGSRGGGSGGGGTGGGSSGYSGSVGTGGGQVFGGGIGSNSSGTNDPLQSGGNSFTMNDLTGGDNDVGSRSWERVENFQGRPRGKAGGDEVAGGFGNQAGGSFGNTGGSFGGNGSGMRRGANSGTDTGFSGGPEVGTGDGISRGSYAGNGGGAGSGPGGDQGDGTEDGPGGSMAGGPGGGNGGGLNAGTGGGPGGGAGGQGSATSDRGNSRMSQGNGNRSSGGRIPGNSSGTTFNGSVSGGVGSGQSSDGWGEPEPGMPIGQRPNRKSSKSKSGGDGESYGPGGDSDGDGNFAQGERSSGSRSGGQSGSSGSSGLSDSGSSSPRFSHTKGSATRAARPGERPSKKSNDDDKPLEPEMLAGRRWGFCEPGASIGFEREVRVDVTEDKLLIAEKYAIPVGQGESRQETLELFATALDNYSHEWGRPPQGFFWAPRLKFIVKPEGNGHYEQVNAMMTRAGLATSHEFSKQNETIEFGRDTASATKPAKKPAPKTAASTKAGANR